MPEFRVGRMYEDREGGIRNMENRFVIATRIGEMFGRERVYGYWGSTKEEALKAHRLKKNIRDDREFELACEVSRLKEVELYKEFTYRGREYA